MNERFAKLIYGVLFLLALDACAQVPRDLAIKVSDDTGRLLVNANVSVTFAHVHGPELVRGVTDMQGEFRAHSGAALETTVVVGMRGHYNARMVDVAKYGIPSGVATIPVVLPRVINPVPLYVLRVDLDMPAGDEWGGYDLQNGDWLPPHGAGKVCDVRLRFRNEFIGYRSDGESLERARELSRMAAERRGGVFSEAEFRKSAGHWRGELEIAFPGAKEGIVEEAEKYWPYGDLRLPHLAPEEGYESERGYQAATTGFRASERHVGYFLRSRVRLDRDGIIVSANYAKIYGEIQLDPRGTVSFCYYFNPVANDRNLEFDPTQNLFPRTRRGANVANP